MDVGKDNTINPSFRGFSQDALIAFRAYARNEGQRISGAGKSIPNRPEQFWKNRVGK